MRRSCECCDPYWHEPSSVKGLTRGEKFFLIGIMAGGFHMVSSHELKTSKSKCVKREIKKFLKLGYIYNNGQIFTFTEKGLKFYRTNIND